MGRSSTGRSGASEGGEPFDSVMPVRPLEVDIKLQSELDPDRTSVSRSHATGPNRHLAIHLYAKARHALVRAAPMEFDRLQSREYELKGEWRPDIEYSLEIDSAAFPRHLRQGVGSGEERI